MDGIDLKIKTTLRDFTTRYEPPPNTKKRMLWQALLQQEGDAIDHADFFDPREVRMPRDYAQVHFAWNMLYSQCYSHVCML